MSPDSSHRVGQIRGWGGREPVIALEISGHTRAYPLQILICHEIVNDRLGDTPVAVTFCPLCNAAMVFDRKVAGRELDFGTTGRLRKSDLVMYDRQTQSWWQQFTGEAIVGHYAGQHLRPLPAAIISYQDFKRVYPHGEILSRDTGHRRPYGRNPYRDYDRVGESPFLFDDATDPRLPAMERVLAVRHRNIQRLYPYTLLEERPAINDQLGDLPVVILSTPGMRSALDRARISESRLIPAAAAYSRRLGERTLSFRRDAGGSIRDRETGSMWAITGQALEGPLRGKRLEPLGGGVHFAFAWLAFHPDSEIYASER
jgi:hypothetical protein